MTTIICAENLEVGYHHALLPPVDFAIQNDQYWGLVGHNGSGKSTLLKTLLSVTPKIGGNFTINGKVAYVPQRSLIDSKYPMRAIDIVSNGSERGWSFLSPRFPAKQKKDLLKVMADTKTLDLGNLAFSALSEGQKQRVLIARALVSKPDLLILDEPSSAMDSRAESETLDLIDEIKKKQGLAILIVTHHLETISDRLSHLIVIDRHAKISIGGTFNNVTKDAKVAQLYGHVFSRNTSC